MTVAYAELDGSPQERYGLDGSFHATRRLICAWADRHTLLGEFAVGGGTAYPYNTNVGARACGASIVPFDGNSGGSGGTASYGTAEVDIEYAFDPSQPRLLSGKMIVEELHPWLEYRAIDPMRCHVGTATGRHPARAPRLLVAGADYSLSFFGVNSAPGAGLTLPGYVNASAFSTYRLGLAWPAKCLLYTGAGTRDEMRLGVKDKFQLTYRFKFRSVEWSKELTEEGWQTVYNSAGNEIYATADFTTLTAVT